MRFEGNSTWSVAHSFIHSLTLCATGANDRSDILALKFLGRQAPKHSRIISNWMDFQENLSYLEKAVKIFTSEITAYQAYRTRLLIETETCCGHGWGSLHAGRNVGVTTISCTCSTMPLVQMLTFKFICHGESVAHAWLAIYICSFNNVAFIPGHTQLDCSLV